MERTFGMTPPSTTPYIFLLAIGALLVGVLGLLVSIGYTMKNVRFDVSEEGLRIRGGIYGRFIPKEAIDTAGVKIIDLRVSQEYNPGIRTNGVGLPGYGAGWFRLKNKEKALLFVTGNSNIVYIPTSQGYSVLLSAKDSQGFYEAIKGWK